MQEITPSNGMSINQDIRLKPGLYHLPEGLQITGENITIEGQGATILSDKQEGTGISIKNSQQLTLRNISVKGFYHGIRVEDSSQITIENATVRDTQEIKGVETFLYLWLPIEKCYGGAILFHNVGNSNIVSCDVQHQMNGILLYDCQNLSVEKNNGSFNSGWGVYLSNTSDSQIRDNQLDFCNRVFRHDNGLVRVEADAAGIVLVKASSRNHFLRNSCLCGGDGVFLCGYEHPGKITPCNDNVFEENDCRLSPNNAIEATFSGGNIFRRNDCSRSNYAFWMGYSYDNIIEENIIEFNRWAGIAIEHAYGFTICKNRIHLNGEGIRLFTRGGAVTDYFPNRRVTYNMSIEENDIAHNRIGIHAFTGDETTEEHCHNLTIQNNQFTENQIGLQLKGIHNSLIARNHFRSAQFATIKHSESEELRFENNSEEA